MSNETQTQSAANTRMITELMFRLLPLQVLLAVIGGVNGVVSSLFATNFVGTEAMGAVTLYGPFAMLLGAIGAMLFSGATILSGKYMGMNDHEKMQNVFSVDLTVSAVIAAAVTVLLLILGGFGLTGFMTKDPEVSRLFNKYLIGQAIGVFPAVIGTQLSAFLSLENNVRRSTTASLVYIAANILFNFLFVQVLHLESLGLALASSLGMWVFCLIEAQYFFTDRALLHLKLQGFDLRGCADIVKIGYPGALSSGYQTIRGLAVNMIITAYVGSIGLSAFGVVNNVMGIMWAIPAGMQAVSRMMLSVSAGEEDRQTLTDVMRVTFRRFIPIMIAIAILIMLSARLLTGFYYHEPSDPVYMMTVWGFRIIPFAMPLGLIFMNFTAYAQIFGKMGFVHVSALLDGVVDVVAFSALLVPMIGMNGVYAANVINGVITTLVVVIYAVIKIGHMPRNMEELMVIPKEFGVSESERMDLSVRSIEEVVNISQAVQTFCLERGIDDRRSHLAGLAMEEMAGNIVDHGFHKDKKPHSVDIRVVHKGDDVILRLKDDCKPFDPEQRRQMSDPEDVTSNIGLRMVFGIARDVSYQSILGMNVLAIRI